MKSIGLKAFLEKNIADIANKLAHYFLSFNNRTSGIQFMLVNAHLCLNEL